MSFLILLFLFIYYTFFFFSVYNFRLELCRIIMHNIWLLIVISILAGWARYNMFAIYPLHPYFNRQGCLELSVTKWFDFQNHLNLLLELLEILLFCKMHIYFPYLYHTFIFLEEMVLLDKTRKHKPVSVYYKRKILIKNTIKKK